MIRLSSVAIEPEGCLKDESPIIFLHGVTASKEFWNDIPKKIAEATKRKVYAYDARNHGDSEWVDNSTMEDNVQDLFAFMDSISAEKAILVGHSMGGITSIAAALAKPDRFEKIVVEDMTVTKPKVNDVNRVLVQNKLLREAIAKVPAELNHRDANAFIFDYVFNSFPPEMRARAQKYDADQVQLALKRNERGEWEFKANMEELFSIVKKIPEKRIQLSDKYKGPALFVYGKKSEFRVWEDEHIIKEYFPNAELIGIEDAMHSVHIDHPNEFLDAVLKFLL